VAGFASGLDAQLGAASQVATPNEGALVFIADEVLGS